MSRKRLKIAFVGSSEAKSRLSSWPGTQYYMANALRKHCGDILFVGPVRSSFEVLAKVFSKALQISTGKKYDYNHSTFLARRLAKIVGNRMSGQESDLLFVPATSTETAFVDGDTPIVYTSDATFAAVRDYYPVFSNILQRSLREADSIEQKEIDKARLITYPSEWARQSAVDDYHAEESKVHVIPYGANLEDEDIPPRELVMGKKRSDSCRMLFLGVDWERKGGAIAFDTLVELERMGVRAELIVCGCIPPSEFSHERMTVIPYLSKGDDEQRKRLADLMLSSDFLLLPTRGECYGMVFCEASAFGIPSIATRTGGVPGAIKDGENGYTLPVDAVGRDYAELIRDIYTDDQRYTELSRTSREAFEEKLNWDAWGASVSKLIMDTI